MPVLKFSRTISIQPDAEEPYITLASLRNLLGQADALQFPDSAEVLVRPIPSARLTENFAIQIIAGSE